MPAEATSRAMRFFVESEGKVLGPFTESEIVDRLRANEFSFARVRPESSETWHDIRTFRNFRSELGTLRPPASSRASVFSLKPLTMVRFDGFSEAGGRKR
jgi:hypothetical protein